SLPRYFRQIPTPPSGTARPALHDALPIFPCRIVLVGKINAVIVFASNPTKNRRAANVGPTEPAAGHPAEMPNGRDQHGLLPHPRDRKSTRLNSSHVQISYAVSCFKQKRLR